MNTYFLFSLSCVNRLCRSWVIYYHWVVSSLSASTIGGSSRWRSSREISSFGSIPFRYQSTYSTWQTRQHCVEFRRGSGLWFLGRTGGKVLYICIFLNKRHISPRYECYINIDPYSYYTATGCRKEEISSSRFPILQKHACILVQYVANSFVQCHRFI